MKPNVPLDPVADLPFVRGVGRNRCFWAPPKPRSYQSAVRRGRIYADTFLAYAKENTAEEAEYLLGWIVSDMNVADQSEHSGYLVGFFSRISQELA